MLSCWVVSDSLQQHGPARLLVHEDSPGRNTGMGFHVLLQGIFPTQGSNPCLLHCRQIIYCLSHQGSPLYRYLEIIKKKNWTIKFDILFSTKHIINLFPCYIVFRNIILASVAIQLLIWVQLFVTPWTAACQASLFAISQSLGKHMFIESMMPSNHLILCCPPSPPALNLPQHQGLYY